VLTYEAQRSPTTASIGREEVRMAKKKKNKKGKKSKKK
jgi:hypothetical protein